MPTPLSRDINYCYYPKSGYTGGKVTGLTNSEVCIVGTKAYIFVLPYRDFTSYLVAMRIRSYQWADGVSMQAGLEQMFADPRMTVEELEATLCDMLGEANHDQVLKVSELTQFKVHLLGILSQARIRHAAGGAIKVIFCKGKGNMKRFKEFYFPS